MYTRFKYALPLFILLAGLLVACGSQAKFVAPEIAPPDDLIPAYLPDGFELISGFELPGELTSLQLSTGDEASFFVRPRRGIPFFEGKSPAGNVIQGVYYQGKEYLLLITKSYYPNGDMDKWLVAYNAGLPEHCDCDCAYFPHLDSRPFLERNNKIHKVSTIDGTRVAILEVPQGWSTFFIRGDYLLSVQSGISLEENLKIVTSLLKP